MSSWQRLHDIQAGVDQDYRSTTPAAKSGINSSRSPLQIAGSSISMRRR